MKIYPSRVTVGVGLVKNQLCIQIVYLSNHLLFRTLEVTRVSTIASVIYEDFHISNMELRVSIKFYDFAIPLNSTSSSYLDCASAKIPSNPNRENILDSLWTLNDPDCKLEKNNTFSDGTLTCICNKPGTFAIIDHKTIDDNEVRTIYSAHC